MSLPHGSTRPSVPGMARGSQSFRSRTPSSPHTSEQKHPTHGVQRFFLRVLTRSCAGEQKDYEETETWSLSFWVRPKEGSLGMPNNFWFAINAFSTLAPPLLLSHWNERYLVRPRTRALAVP
eukprot:1687486-Rhodomonas_salina.2